VVNSDEDEDEADGAIALRLKNASAEALAKITDYCENGCFSMHRIVFSHRMRIFSDPLRVR